MNRLPTKQIYMLTIIIVGIIALSVYSTYALFTFESSTSDIVSIHTPKSLKISENIYEYNQIKISPNTIATTDIDIYNSYDHEVCYSIWYKIIGSKDTQNKVQLFEISDSSLTSSGVLPSSGSLRVTIAIINDNEEEIKVNIGTIGSSKEANSCSLNLSDDKSVINQSYKSIEKLTTKFINNDNEPKEEEANYLTYKNINKTFTYNETDKIYVAKNFEYNNEEFNLLDKEELTLEEILTKQKETEDKLYFCETEDDCKIIYQIIDVDKKEISIDEETEEKIYEYNITKYNKLIGYSSGENGLRVVNKTDYVFYGDNPNNFIYYNCQNNADLNTCELWRIVGFFYDIEKKEYVTKIVRNDSIGKYHFDNPQEENKETPTNIWNNTTLYKYLNEKYKFINNYDIYITEYPQKMEMIPNLEIDVKNIQSEDKNITSKVNLLNLSDYLYTSVCDKITIKEYTDECLTNNWLNNIEITNEWTLTSKEIIEEPKETETTENIENDNTENPDEELSNEEQTNQKNEVINYIYSIGSSVVETPVSELQNVRPTVFLKSRLLLLGGEGTLDSPYIVK